MLSVIVIEMEYRKQKKKKSFRSVTRDKNYPIKFDWCFRFRYEMKFKEYGKCRNDDTLIER